MAACPPVGPLRVEGVRPVRRSSVALAGFGTGSCGALDAADGIAVRQNPTSTDGLDLISVDELTSTVTMDVTGTEPGAQGLAPSFPSEVAFEEQDTDEKPDVQEADGRACDPPEQIGHGVELEHLENDEFHIMVCENNSELLYFGHSKDNLGSIVLDAQATDSGYVAMNGVYSYEVRSGNPVLGATFVGHERGPW